MKEPLIFKNLDEVFAFLQSVKTNDQMHAVGEWDVNQNLNHCAQSIEFALTGYPFEKSKIFQNTIGKLVFNYFDWRGYMRHPTNKQNEGEPFIPKGDSQRGIERLEEAIIKFERWEAPLHPHRFYGKLSKKRYAKAHTMHIANHLELIHFG